MIQSRDEMHAQMESVKNYLQAKVIQLERAQMGMLQWQAQVEACVVKIEATLTEMHERQRRNDERSEAVYQACTSAVGNADPATRTALETLAGRVDELESVARKAVQDSTSSQNYVQALESDLQIRHEQLLTQLEALQQPSQVAGEFEPMFQWDWPEWPHETGTPWPSYEAPPGLPYEMTAGAQSTNAQFYQISSPQPHEADAEGAPGLAVGSEGVATGATTVVPPVEAPVLGHATDPEDLDMIPNQRWKCLMEVPHFDPKDGAGTPWELGLRFDVWKKQFLTVDVSEERSRAS